MNPENGKTLILLENEAQVVDCLQWLREVAGERIIIALSPFAMYELDKRRTSYKIPEEYYSPQDLYNSGMANFQKIEDLCAIIDGTILRSCPSARKINIMPALFNFYHLKMMYDTVLVRIFQLSSIFDAEKPDIVYIYNTVKYPFGCYENAPFIQFDNRESIYAQLLMLGGWKFQVKILQSIQVFGKTINKKRTKHLFINLKNYISKHLTNPELQDSAVVMSKLGIAGLFNWLKYCLRSTEKRASVALLGHGYEWDESIIELRAEEIGPLCRVRYDLCRLLASKVEKTDTAWEELLANQDFSKFFVYRDIDFFPVVEERLRLLTMQLTTACIIAAHYTENLIEKRKIKAFISPVISNCLEHSAARIARDNGIPVITWQHGAYGAMHHPIINYMDLISSDFHFVFGKGVEERYAQQAKIYGTTLVSIGSASLDKLRTKYSNEKRMLRGKKVVLYITSSGYQNNFYISYYPPFSDNLFWQTQKAIIDTLGNHNEYSVIMKLHPSPIYKESDFQSYVIEKGFKNFQFIKNEKSIVELLSLADVIVIDLPSTTLLQALTTNKPLFVYMGHIQFDTKAYKLLANRAVCYEKLEDFLYELDVYLHNQKYPKDLFNNEYLEMFGTTTEEGFAAKRAAKKLKEIIDSNVDGRVSSQAKY